MDLNCLLSAIFCCNCNIVSVSFYSSGTLRWQVDLKSPVVAMYSIEGDGLHKLPFLILSNESLDYVRRGLTSLSEVEKSNFIEHLS